MIRHLLVLFLLATPLGIVAQHKVISLYNGVAPGSESWTWEEKEFFVKQPLNAAVVYNVSKPTLTVFAPEKPNGMAVIVCAGGGFRVLNIIHEGRNVAAELSKRGITVFVLKYRLAETKTDDPWAEMMSKLRDTMATRTEIAGIIELAANDVDETMRYVRMHAGEYKIDDSKIGILGFSAGGSLAIRLAYGFKADTRPAFAAAIYSGKPKEYPPIPANAPPLFIAAASDDLLAPIGNQIEMYNTWIKAGGSAEMHIYAKGGHGLRAGANARTWIHRFDDWLNETLANISKQ